MAKVNFFWKYVKSKGQGQEVNISGIGGGGGDLTSWQTNQGPCHSSLHPPGPHPAREDSGVCPPCVVRIYNGLFNAKSLASVGTVTHW